MSSNSSLQPANGSIDNAGVGYGVAIAVGVLVLLSTTLLASYVCLRLRARRIASVRTDPPVAADPEAALGSQPAAAGLDDATLESYPKIAYSAMKPPPQAETSCSICLADYRNSEILRLLPDCRHVFHALCVDAWLRLHASCPVCRSSPLPTPQTTPGSTPLSDLIPLARNPIRYSIRHHF